MLMTATELRELGCQNVISNTSPSVLINGVPIDAKTYIYDNIDALKQSWWYNPAEGGGLLFICSSEDQSIDSSTKVVVRIFGLRDTTDNSARQDPDLPPQLAINHFRIS